MEEGFNLTAEIMKELAEKGNAVAATAKDPIDFWLKSVIPDSKRATAAARAGAAIFDADERAVVAGFIREAWRRYCAFTNNEEGFELDEFERERREVDEAAQRADRALQACRDALAGLAAGKGDTAALALLAARSFGNVLKADDPEEALRKAFDEADAAARAYFVEIRGSGAGPGSTAAMLKRIDANTAITAGRAKAASKRGVEYRNAQLEADKEERDRKRRDREKWIVAGRRLMKKGQSARSAAKNIHAREGCPYSESYLADLFSCRKKRRR